MSIRATKYIHKYIFKGHDIVTLAVEHDEVKQYLDCRWLAAGESNWRIFAYRIHNEQPPIQCLPVHLPDQQLIFFDPEQNANAIIEQAGLQTTKLLAFFRLNEENPAAQVYLYSEIPQHYVWKPKGLHNRTPKWDVWKRGFALGCMFFCSPSSGE